MLKIKFDFNDRSDPQMLAKLKEEAKKAQHQLAENSHKTGEVIITDRAGIARQAIRKVKGVILVTNKRLKVPRKIFSCTPGSFALYLEACLTVHY